MGFEIRSLLCYVWAVVFIVGGAGAQHASNTPVKFANSFDNLVVCETITLNMVGSEPPYTIAWIVDDQTVDVEVVIDDTTTDWTIDIGPNLPFTMTLSDSNDNNSTYGPLTTKLGTKQCDLVAGTLDGKPDSSTPSLSSSPTPSGRTPTSVPGYSAQASLSSHPNSSTNLPPPPTNPLSVGGSTGDNKTSGPSASTIGFVVLAVVLGLLIVVLAIFWFRRRQRRRPHHQIDLLAEDKFDPSFLEAQVIQPFTGSVQTHTEESDMVIVERPAEGSSAGRVLVAQFHDPVDNLAPQLTYTEKVAAMRPRKGLEPSFNTVRLESGQTSSSGSAAGTSNTYPPTSSYPPSVVSSSSSPHVSSRPSKARLDIAHTPSVRSAASEASEDAITPTNDSSASLIPTQRGPSHREADGGVSLAGGPRGSWNVGGGTLPPAYGDF